jgi:hypothetical protein
MITVLINVARLEFIPCTPTFPKIAVSPAKKAEPKANICHPFNPI